MGLKLDSDHCDHEDKEMYLHSKCHMDMPTWVVMTKTGLRIECCICGKEIATFEIKQKES